MMCYFRGGRLWGVFIAPPWAGWVRPPGLAGWYPRAWALPRPQHLQGAESQSLWSSRTTF